jgi:hypothetical protein
VGLGTDFMSILFLSHKLVASDKSTAFLCTKNSISEAFKLSVLNTLIFKLDLGFRDIGFELRHLKVWYIFAFCRNA